MPSSNASVWSAPGSGSSTIRSSGRGGPPSWAAISAPAVASSPARSEIRTVLETRLREDGDGRGALDLAAATQHAVAVAPPRAYPARDRGVENLRKLLPEARPPKSSAESGRSPPASAAATASSAAARGSRERRMPTPARITSAVQSPPGARLAKPRRRRPRFGPLRGDRSHSLGSVEISRLRLASKRRSDRGVSTGSGRGGRSERAFHAPGPSARIDLPLPSSRPPSASAFLPRFEHPTAPTGARRVDGIAIEAAIG